MSVIQPHQHGSMHTAGRRKGLARSKHREDAHGNKMCGNTLRLRENGRWEDKNG